MPLDIKLAKVIPDYKSDDIKMQIYRPISVLDLLFFSKIIENVTYNRTIVFTKHNILNDKQYGFRRKYSIYMAILETVDQISNAVDEKDSTFGIFVDLSKAFDTVNHKILLYKLKYYGIRGSVLQKHQQ